MKSRALAGVLSLLFLGGCASLRLSFEREWISPLQRITLTGYSFSSPNEPGWQKLRRPRSPVHQMLLRRSGENGGETFMVEAFSNRIQDSSQFNKRTLQLIGEANAWRPKASPRYKRLKEDLAMSRQQGMDCIRGYSVDEDYEGWPIKAPGKSEYMIVELAYISCFHPRDRLIAIGIDYSQRYYPNHQDPHFLDKANAIFNTIEVTNP
jgi:hypothetical protein